LTVVLCVEHSDVLQHVEPYEGCLFISFKNYLKHINERLFVLTNNMNKETSIQKRLNKKNYVIFYNKNKLPFMPFAIKQNIKFKFKGV